MDDENGPLTIDWDDDDDGFSLLPDGPYDMTLTGVELKTSNAGDPLITVEFTTDDSAEQYPNRKIWDNWSMHPNAVKVTLSKMKVLGIKGVGTQNFEGREALADWAYGKIEEAIGLEVVVVAGARVYKDKNYNEVKKVQLRLDVVETTKSLL